MNNIFSYFLIFILTTNYQYLPYQAHNFENYKKIKQLIIKGVRYFKIDIDAISEDDCKKYGDRDEYDTLNIHYNSIVICLGLQGDSSGAPFPQDNFQTAETFTDFLNSKDLQNLLSQIKEQVWFRINYIAFNQISLDQSLMYNFFGNLIDISKKYNNKIKFGIEPCIPQMIKEYCVGIIKQLCDKFTFISKLRDTEEFYCSNQQQYDQQKNYYYIEKKDIKKNCEIGFDKFQDSPIPFEFNRFNNSEDINNTLQFLQEKCVLLKNHQFMLGTNLDIDQFRIIYYMKNITHDKLYYKYQLQENEKLLNFFYIEKYDKFIIILEQDNIQSLLIVKIDSEGFKVLNKIILVLQMSNIKYQNIDNFLIVYNQNNAYKIEIEEDNTIKFIEIGNQNQCQIMIFENNIDYQCINLIKNVDNTYSLSFQLIKQQKLQTEDQVVFSLPSSIYNIIDIQVQKIQNKFMIVLTNKELDDLDKIHEYSYLIYIDVQKKILGRFVQFIGHIENIDIYQDDLIILVNNQQSGSGSRLLNGSDKNICKNQYTYFDKQYNKINRSQNLGYYYGKLSKLIELKDNKFMSQCDDDFLHGNLGFSNNSITRFVKKNDKYIPIIIKKNADILDIDQFQFFFGGHNQEDFAKDTLMIFEIPIDSYLKF